MAPGEYESGTQTPEVMRVISGELVVLLPEASAWETFSAGQAFKVPAGRNFQLRVAAPASYLCLYGS